MFCKKTRAWFWSADMRSWQCVKSPVLRCGEYKGMRPKEDDIALFIKCLDREQSEEESKRLMANPSICHLCKHFNKYQIMSTINTNVLFQNTITNYVYLYISAHIIDHINMYRSHENQYCCRSMKPENASIYTITVLLLSLYSKEFCFMYFRFCRSYAPNTHPR